MNNKLTDKDKKDWEKFLSSKEKLPNKDSNSSKEKVKKIINIGVSFSIFGHKLGRIIEEAIEKVFNNSLGFILLIEVKK